MPVPKGVRIAGRQKGTPNKKKSDIQERLAQLGCDPVAGLATLAKDAKTSPGLKAEILSDLMSYCYPKKKAIEVTGEGGGPVQVNQNMQALNAALAQIELRVSTRDNTPAEQK